MLHRALGPRDRARGFCGRVCALRGVRTWKCGCFRTNVLQRHAIWCNRDLAFGCSLFLGCALFLGRLPGFGLRYPSLEVIPLLIFVYLFIEPIKLVIEILNLAMNVR